MEKSYLGKLGYLVLKSRLPALHSCHGAMKTHVNRDRTQTVHRNKVDQGVIDLVRGDQLPGFV